MNINQEALGKTIVQVVIIILGVTLTALFPMFAGFVALSFFVILIVRFIYLVNLVSITEKEKKQ